MEQISKWINIYLSNIRSQGLSENTVKAYERTLRLFANWKKTDGVETTSQELAKFFDEINAKKNLKPASLHQYNAAISAFYKFLVKMDVVDRNPMDRIDRPKVKSPNVTCMNHSEVMGFIETLKRLRNPVYSLIVRTIYATGMRISELCNLRIENIDFENETIQVLGKGNKQRTVCIEPQTLTMIKDHIGTRTTGYVFEGNSEGHISVLAVEKVFERHAPEGITPHKIRHSFANELYKASHDITAVQSSLGHNSIQTTRIYLHPDLKEQKKAYSSFPLQIQTA